MCYFSYALQTSYGIKPYEILQYGSKQNKLSPHVNFNSIHQYFNGDMSTQITFTFQ